MPDIFISPSSDNKSPVPADFISSSNNIFSAFLYKPTNVKFQNQEENEIILLLLRKHWVTNLGWILVVVFLIIAPIFLFPALSLGGFIPSQIPKSIIAFSILAWYLLTFTYSYVNFILWYFNIWIVTNERLIDIDFANLLNKKFAETRIVRIEDVVGRTKGFIGSFFDYGDVYAQTAGTEPNFEAYSVPHPAEIVRIINRLMGREERKPR